MLAVVGDGTNQVADAKKIACGNSHSLLLVQSGEVENAGTKILGWGGNRHNPLAVHQSPDDAEGGGKDKAWRAASSSVLDEPSDKAFSRLNGEKRRLPDLLEVSCGSNHSAVLEVLTRRESKKSDSIVESRLWTCGLSANGRLGHGEEEKAATASQGLLAESRPRDDETPMVPREVVFRPGPGYRGIAVQRVSCGADHTLAIVDMLRGGGEGEMGRVFAWGLGSFGALGTRSWADEWSPREIWFPGDEAEIVPGDGRCVRRTQIYQVAAGTKHSIALSKEGLVYTWGFAGNGRLGLGHTKVRGQHSYEAQTEPRLVHELERTQIKYVAAGEAHTAAVDQLGGIYTWGQGSHGRCGHGVTNDSPEPTRVETLLGLAMSQVALGLLHSVAMSVKGDLYAWGKGPATGLDAVNNETVQIPRKVEFEDKRELVYQIAAGPLHTLVLTFEGSLYCFGSGSDGRLPFRNFDSIVQRDQPIPKKMTTQGWKQAPSKDGGPSKKNGQNLPPSWWPSMLTCGSSGSAILTGTGVLAAGAVAAENLWLWGSNTISAVGDSSNIDPTLRDRQGHCWTPVPLKTGVRCRTVRMVALGFEHCLIVTADSLMYSWGDGSKGQLGTGSMKAALTPQRITRPTDVLFVAAGEEHSACIIEGGECFTWGNAEGGRLGLGESLNEGEQLMPKRVVIETAEACILQSVSCGSQHSACITQDRQLLTFGTGWFGRLGHGDQFNQYSPEKVKVPGLQVNDVHCALYHTCIVDAQNHLWVCGRDSSLCRDGLGHVLEPTLFEPFQQEPVRLVRSLATCEQHTIVVTVQQIRPEGVEVLELWVWGKNDRGQLGLPPASVPVIESPWQLQIPELQDLQRRKKVQFELMQVATGPHHSMCMVKVKLPDSEAEWQPDIFAWGYSGFGRLGLEDDVEEGLKMLRIREEKQGAPPERTQMSGAAKHVRMYPPCKVAARWKPARGRSDDAKDEDSSIMDALLAKPSERWVDAQQKLCQQPFDQKTKRLDKLQEKVQKQSSSLLAEMLAQWNKPTSGDGMSEYTLRQKEREVEAEYVRTLKALELAGSSKAPRVAIDKEYKVKTDPEIQQKMLHFEELIWAFQQQPGYLAYIATKVSRRKLEDPEVNLFHRVCAQIYADLGQPRIVCLFKTLLGQVIRQELKEATSVEDLFHPIKSRAAGLFKQLTTDSSLIQNLALRILDPTDEKSLVFKIMQFTLTEDGDLDGDQPRGYGSEGAGPVEGVFTTLESEYNEELVQPHYADWREDPASMREMKNWKKRFQKELNNFGLLFRRDVEGHGAEEVKAKAEDEPGRWSHGIITSFLKRFVTEVLDEETGVMSIRSIFASCFENLVDKPYTVSFRNDAEHTLKAEVCLPIACLVLGLVGNVLAAVGTNAFSLLRLSIKKACKEKFTKMVEQQRYRRKSSKEKNDFEPDTKEMQDRVLWNIAAMAKVFQRCVHREDMFKVQFARFLPEGAKIKEEKTSAVAVKALEEVACKSLFDMLQPRTKGGRARRESGEDTTAEELTEVFYTSHLTFQKSHVSMSTKDMQELCNLSLKCCREDGQLAGNPAHDEAVVLAKGFTEGRIAELLEEIMPKRIEEGGYEETEEYEHGLLWLAGMHGEWHNFHMSSRFLEFMHKPHQEPIFCEVSKAPVPRYLAIKEEQRKPAGTMLLRRLQPPAASGPGSAFETLQDLMEELAGDSSASSTVRYPIQGSKWSELRASFAKIQSVISQEMKEGNAPEKMRALVLRLEEGKDLIQKIQDSKKEFDLLACVDENVKSQQEHLRYLEHSDIILKKVFAARDHYRKKLEKHVVSLKQVAKVTTLCEVPHDILLTAQQRSSQITFVRVKKAKMKIRKTQPTPGQLVLEQLGDQDGVVISEELKESVGIAVSYNLSELVGKGVVVRVNEILSKKVRKGLQVSFEFNDEGCLIQILHQSTLLKEFTLTREHIFNMQASLKTTVLPYGDNFLWMNTLLLRRLLAWIAAEGAI